MIAVATAGGTVTLYSSRFSLTGMTGSFSTTVKSALSDISGTSGPDVDNEAVTDSSGTSAAGTNSYGVEYTLQTGSTRYAPMIPTPHTTITATNTSPLFPTSAVTYATTYMGSPDVYTTLTQSATYSASSIENTASAASMPSDDMAKFLRRWRD
ncbi:MAG: hypothetical protein M1834_000595 [Cirrosporium novae-zelandiae]|nr:MAG: hypothetical protein M1834_000595 [Cirrosporium novae-zelandiae]